MEDLWCAVQCQHCKNKALSTWFSCMQAYEGAQTNRGNEKEKTGLGEGTPTLDVRGLEEGNN